MSEPSPHGFPWVARVFLLTGLLGGLVLAVGLVLALLEGDVRAPFVAPTLQGLSRLEPPAVLTLGLAILLALPLVRNVAVILVTLRRDRPAPAMLAFLVLLTLLTLYGWVLVS